MGKNAKLEITLWLSALGVLTACLGGAIFHRLTDKESDSPGAQARNYHNHTSPDDRDGKAPADHAPPTVVTVSAESTAPDFVASSPGNNNWTRPGRRNSNNDGSNNAGDSASMMPREVPHDVPRSDDPLAAEPTNSQQTTIATAPQNDVQPATDPAPLPNGPQSSNLRSGSRVMLKTIPEYPDAQEPGPLPVVDARPIRQDSEVVPVVDNAPGADLRPAPVNWPRSDLDARAPVVGGPVGAPPAPLPRGNDALSAVPDYARAQQGNLPPPGYRPPANDLAEPQYSPGPNDRSRFQPPAVQSSAMPTPSVASNVVVVSSAQTGTSAVTRKDDKYNVQPNDNWWTISQRVYGNGAFYKALHEYNRREFPRADQLAVGDSIRTPDLTVLQRNYPDLTPKARKPATATDTHMANVSAHLRPGTRSYTVQQGDTLFDIARFQLGKASRWTEIYELNRQTLSEDYDFVRPGTQLLLPADEAHGERPDPTARNSNGTLQR